jgi:hypothetical protein
VRIATPIPNISTTRRTEMNHEGEGAMTHAVWYNSAGCLPDGDGPEFEGSFDECLAWVEANRDDYDTSVLYSLYIEPV